MYADGRGCTKCRLTAAQSWGARRRASTRRIRSAGAARWCSKNCTFERPRGFKAHPAHDIKEGLRGSLRGQPQRSGGRMFSSIEEVIEQFAGQKYIASRRIATVVYL